jgi:glycosyltransferase involved in cell wall biosynthesis
MKPLVSILIPSYNAQEWMAETIESALAQTWPAKEILVVDDGSKDQSVAIAKRYEDKNVKVVVQENQGAAAARNTAYAHAQGDYIQWLDADDVLDPQKVEHHVRRIQNGAGPRTLLSGAWGHFIYRKSKARFVPTPLWNDLSPVEWLVRKMGQNLHMQTDNWLVSRELTEAAGPWDIRLFRDNDGEYFSRVILSSDGVQFVPEAKSYYRNAGFKSISYIGGSNKKLESLLISMKLHIKYLRSLEDSERTRAACVFYVRTWMPEVYLHRPDLAQQLKDWSVELGGQAENPRLPRKYRWLEPVMGWHAGRRTELALQRVNATAKILWDKMMQKRETRRAAGPHQRQPDPQSLGGSH